MDKMWEGRITYRYLLLLLLLTVTEYLYKEGVIEKRYLPLLIICIRGRIEWERENEQDVRRKED